MADDIVQEGGSVTIFAPPAGAGASVPTLEPSISQLLETIRRHLKGIDASLEVLQKKFERAEQKNK